MIEHGNQAAASVVNGKTAFHPSRTGVKQALRERLKDSLGSDLQQVEKRILAATRNRCEQVNRLAAPAVSLGGKRMRPMLVLLSARSVASSGSRPSRRGDLLSIAASVELVHAASLVHDDVMDGAEERRHQPTLAKLTGNSASILLGDYLFTRAYALAASCRSSYAARKIAEAATDLCAGELRQQLASGRWDLSIREYCQILVQKTASLCAVSCRLGAWTASGSSDEIKALTKFGKALGLAFQIYDDWLDYWGDSTVGKTLGTDFRQGKPTLPLLRLLSQCSASEQTYIQNLLDADSVQARDYVWQALNQSDASRYTLAMARKFASRGVRCLSALPDSESRQNLALLAAYSVDRSL